MTVVNLAALTDFQARYAPARKAFKTWIEIVEASDWSNLIEVQSTFSTADYVAPHVVFNLGGNKYRLITLVKFTHKTVLIEQAMTHEQYNRWKP